MFNMFNMFKTEKVKPIPVENTDLFESGKSLITVKRAGKQIEQDFVIHKLSTTDVMVLIGLYNKYRVKMENGLGHYKYFFKNKEIKTEYMMELGNDVSILMEIYDFIEYPSFIDTDIVASMSMYNYSIFRHDLECANKLANTWKEVL